MGQSIFVDELILRALGGPTGRRENEGRALKARGARTPIADTAFEGLQCSSRDDGRRHLLQRFAHVSDPFLRAGVHPRKRARAFHSAGAGVAGISYPEGWKAWVETAIDRPTRAVTVRLLRVSPCMVVPSTGLLKPHLLWNKPRTPKTTHGQHEGARGGRASRAREISR